MALQDDLRRVGLNPANYTSTVKKTVNRQLVTETVFDEGAARAALAKKQKQIAAADAKQTRAIVSRVTAAAKNRTPSQRLQDFNEESYRAEAKGFRLSKNEKTVLNTKASLATISSPQNLAEALSNYSVALNQYRVNGVQNLTASQKANLNRLANRVMDFDSKDLGPTAKEAIKNISLAKDSIDAIDRQKTLIADYKKQISKSSNPDNRNKLQNLLQIEERKLSSLALTANQGVPRLIDSFGRIGVGDVVVGAGSTDARVGQVDTGLADISANKIFGQSSLVGRLNSQVTDEQIRSDLLNTRKTRAESVFNLGNAALVDLNSQVQQANTFLAGLSSSDPRRKTTQETISRLNKEIADVTADTNAAKAIFDNPGDIDATTISGFRETLRLPEERALDQIGEIDPNLLSTAQGLSDQYKSIATSPLGPTQDARTEQMRGLIEDEALNQLRLGSTLDESVRREVQQAARGAQTARGNIFGVAPAAEEAMQTGLMGEQRKAQRYGAAAAFLSSGQSRGDQAARNTALRQSLDLARLGAANEFLSGGANPYNLANQKVSNQNANFLNYLNAQTAANRGFANTANQVNPYQFVNPNAGLEGARTSAMTYGNLLDFNSRNYSAYAGAQAQVASANSLPNYISAFTNLVPSFSF